MWFKNLGVFRLTEAFTLTPEELEQKLVALSFHPCGPHEESSFGWTSPLGKNSQQLVHSANGFMMLCGKKEERVLPAAVVNELVQEKIFETENRQSRKLSKKERTEIKDELIFELLPKAFTFSRKIHAYIDSKGGWLVVDAASAKSAEDLLSLLRKSLSSLPAVPLNTIEKPTTTMTQWLLNNKAPDDITIEDECELRSPEEAGGIIHCKRHDLALPEIKNHLDNGKEVIKLAVNWADRIAFIIDENLAIKRLRFLDLIQDQVTDIETGDEAAQFDADFSIMSAELAHFLPRLMELFGGENKA
ncbi:MAG: recombination-associated protein RdgC [Methylococcales bacterium]|nr:recombination-associated protein RdgC [Methylococcales bacterium]